MKYNKATILGIIVLLICISALFFVFIFQNKTRRTDSLAAKPKIPITALLYSQRDIKIENSVSIILDSKRNFITGLQMEILYDKDILSGVTIIPFVGEGAFFGELSDHIVLFNKQNEKIGRISYAVGIAPSSLSRAGVGKVAELSYTKKPGTKSTIVTFLPKTRATQANYSGSVLAEAKNIVIE